MWPFPAKSQRAQIESHDLVVGYLFKSALDQVLAGLLHVLGNALAKVVHCAQVKLPFAQVPVAQGVAYLHVEAKVIVGFFVTPAKASFEGLESDQHVDRNVGP